MVIPDANLLLFAHNMDDARYGSARAWWKNQLEGSEDIGLPWNVILAFIRIGTSPKAFPAPFSVDEATDIVKLWLAFPNVRILNPGVDHFRILSDLLKQVGVGNKLVSDAHLAALAIENRATLCSHDRDFQRFSGFRLHDPITY
ncbi:MAG: PIN domain-containing protein [Armatimonadetes bacterium]|nr:PIN domain-containing protein [Armatimonadota bacterium]